MLLDITQLHENHLHSLDIQINKFGKHFNRFCKIQPCSCISSPHRYAHVNEVQTKIKDCLDQAQLHRLAHKIFSNDNLETFKANIKATAKRNGFLSFVTQTTDLFQIPLSYVYQPCNKTVSLILHAPLVKHENLLQCINTYPSLSHMTCHLTILFRQL
jgi:hypothetical protein